MAEMWIARDRGKVGGIQITCLFFTKPNMGSEWYWLEEEVGRFPLPHSIFDIAPGTRRRVTKFELGEEESRT